MGRLWAQWCTAVWRKMRILYGNEFSGLQNWVVVVGTLVKEL